MFDQITLIWRVGTKLPLLRLRFGAAPGRRGEVAAFGVEQGAGVGSKAEDAIAVVVEIGLLQSTCVTAVTTVLLRLVVLLMALKSRC